MGGESIYYGLNTLSNNLIIRYLQHLQHPFIQEMILIITVLSKLEQWLIIKNLLLLLRKNHFIKQE